MIKKLIKYPDTLQYREIIFDVRRQSHFAGMDENNEPIIDETRPKPIIHFDGSVKIHGTNSGVSYNAQNGLWVQNHENIIEVGKGDNAGFAFFVDTHKKIFLDLIDKVYLDNNLSSDEYTVSIYGEWAGQGIQKGVAVTELPKAMYVFGAKVSKPHDADFSAYWVDSSGLSSPENRIFNVADYDKYEIDIDFNDPEASVATLEALTKAVGDECPIGKAFGVSGIGEGIVWVGKWKDNVFKFKTKDTRHAISKTKTVVPVNTEKLNSVNEFIEYAVTENRFNQAIEKTMPSGIDIKKMGELMRWMALDIAKEESDVLVKNGLEPKDVNPGVSNKTRAMFMAALDAEAMTRG